MGKVLDLSRTVYELATEYPELIDIMAELGFTEITKKPMLESVGKIMTIPKGAVAKEIPMEKVIFALMDHGFELAGSMPDMSKKAGAPMPSGENNQETGVDADDQKTMNQIPDAQTEESSENRTAQLKSYLKRLGAGEDLESVRADFVKAFKEVDASEIMKAEQELLREGTPITEVQKLCDVHSALFHGATREERIAKADEAVRISMGQSSKFPKADYSNKKERAAALVAFPGHPLHTFTRENTVLTKLIKEAKQAIADKQDISELLNQIREISIHYAKKGDLLYPHLKTKYGISGPSDVMWTVDDEIRDEIGGLAKRQVRDAEWFTDFDAVLTRADEMIYKEANILFPNCAVNFTDEEWMEIYLDSKDYADCFGIVSEVWEEAEKHADTRVKKTEEKIRSKTDEIVMPGGHMTLEQLTALLNTIPLEITFVDADDINRFFNEGPKVFKRPGMAIDREVYSCHPPKIEPMVRSIIEDFRAGTRDRVPVWMDKGGKTMLVTYMAVRDKEKKYLGTVELIQDMEFAKEHFAK